MTPTLVTVGLVVFAIGFDFLNGLHDSANAIATVVSTRVLRPFVAVLWAAFFNFIAFLVFGLHVADTMGTGLVTSGLIDPRVVFGALAGGIVWDVLTWHFGIPSSSSHALIGGLVGAGVAKAGFGAIIWGGLGEVIAAIVISPLLGLMLAMLLVLLTSWLSVHARPFAVDHRFRALQLVSSAAIALAHGGNDAQKTMGIITVLLFSQGLLHGAFHVPLWVVLACQAAMALGTLAGGWRIIRTVGSRITHLAPTQGFCAETGGAAALFGATFLGIPVSTTQTISGAIVGVGAAKRLSAVRWGVAREIVVAWFLTLPAAALVGVLCYWVTVIL